MADEKNNERIALVLIQILHWTGVGLVKINTRK